MIARHTGQLLGLAHAPDGSGRTLGGDHGNQRRTTRYRNAATRAAWRGFRGRLWQRDIDVRAFIQLNYEPYEGDGAFLAPATARTQASGRS